MRQEYSRPIAVMVALLATAAGCAQLSVPPAAKATRVAQKQCDPAAAQDDVRVLSTTQVLESEPIYSHVISGNNNYENRLNGAKLVIRPPEGVSSERMTRILQCHGARALLGQIDRAELSNDPYWLPNAWVDISVTPDNGNFAVLLSADSIPDNRQVLVRANAFAETHGLARHADQ
jgi:hypothetical protein